MKPRALELVAAPMPEADDTRALRRVAAGDVGALGEVYDRHAEPLLRFAMRVAGRSDADDLMQGTFVTAAKIAATYDGRAASARSWLYGIMARLVQERRRSLSRLARAVLRLGDVASTQFAPNDAERTDLGRALLRLSPAKRVVLLLAEVEGYTCEEIGRMLEIPVGTVWTRLHHARREMRIFLEGEQR